MIGFVSVSGSGQSRCGGRSIREIQMIHAGFRADHAYDVFVMDGYGAIITNVDPVQSVSDLENCYNPIIRKNPYLDLLQEAKERGMKLVIGPGMPDSNGRETGFVGLYCSNYVEVVQKKKKNTQRR